MQIIIIIVFCLPATIKTKHLHTCPEKCNSEKKKKKKKTLFACLHGVSVHHIVVPAQVQKGLEGLPVLVAALESAQQTAT